MTELHGPGGDAGGDPACWAHLLCPECGAVPDDPGASDCARCGAPFGPPDVEAGPIGEIAPLR